ncbi:sigma-54 interaction domain-containing protein [Priestia abyssalis]|uniref:sigma-54 interaction domain-containing protein n=1 Tax=Priestia abyssalis TaxID=1221450 RepID=UPI0009956FA2|nr:sigma 54-interacting transcriptional regulator [Priestia abyssalis]
MVHDASLFVNWDEKEEILSSFNEDIMVTDVNGRIIKVTMGSGEHYGVKPESLLGKNVYDLEKEGIFSPAITPDVLRQKKKVILIQTTSTGKKILVTGIPLFNEDGDIQRIISYTYDLSEMLVIKEYLKELEEELSRMKGELAVLRQQNVQISGLIAESQDMKHVLEKVKKVAGFDVTVLLTGESGVGKSTIAKWIHQKSSRRNGPFIEVNCGTTPEILFEAEFFGYEGRTFDGAERQKKVGILEMVKGGTLLLKEINELSKPLQVKLMKVIQEKQFYRVGGNTPISTDFRLITASNDQLEKAVEENLFREDLFFMLNVIPIHILPLRERKEDLIALIHFFLEKFTKVHGRQVEIEEQALRILQNLPWKGNGRELESTMERLIITANSNRISKENLPLQYQQIEQAETPLIDERKTLPEVLENVEKKMILNVMKKYTTTVEMAKALGISQPSVVRKLKKYTS